MDSPPEKPFDDELLETMMALMIDTSESEQAALRAFAQADEPMNITELAEAYEYSKSTASRNVQTLHGDHNLLEEVDGGYRLSFKLSFALRKFFEYRDELDQWAESTDFRRGD